MPRDTLVNRPRELQVAPDTRMKPRILARLGDWQYLERSIHRLMTAWGRNFEAWDDKSAVHRHIWEQAECVRRLRERISQFPGGRPDDSVSRHLETLANTALLAPSFADAVDGIYQLLDVALVKSYSAYVQSVHPVHDAPTTQLLSEIVAIKEQHRLWWRDYRRRNPHATEAAYRAQVERELSACEDLIEPLPVASEVAAPVGVNTDFRLAAKSARPESCQPKFDFRPYVAMDFVASVETRRLFWCYGYLMEKNIPDAQMQWLWDGHHMPWEFLHDISRHLWDESRHGDSGLSRLLDFGIELDDIGFPPYEEPKGTVLEPMTRKDLYEAVWGIGMIAETGHFTVKQEAYQDFRDGGDLESAEMMLFDIIDESTHVQYAHKWLPVLAEAAGIDNSNYRERAAARRKEVQQAWLERTEGYRKTLQRDLANPDYAFYQRLLTVMREKHPLQNANTCPPRSPLPM
jgi:hypothetical protein